MKHRNNKYVIKSAINIDPKTKNFLAFSLLQLKVSSDNWFLVYKQDEHYFMMSLL
jgi:hypothetical protein